jgi:hypothetical protein
MDPFEIAGVGVQQCTRRGRLRRIIVIAGCSGESRLTIPKPDGAEVKAFVLVGPGRSKTYVLQKLGAK